MNVKIGNVTVTVKHGEVLSITDLRTLVDLLEHNEHTMVTFLHAEGNAVHRFELPEDSLYRDELPEDSLYREESFNERTSREARQSREALDALKAKLKG